MTAATWITRGDLAGLSCPYCGRSISPDTGWAKQAQQAWGRVGVALTHGHETVGLLLLAPTDDPRSAITKCLWVTPGQVGHGYGRRLIQAGAAGMLARDVHAILSHGSRVRKACASPSTDFLRAVGFVKPLDDPLWRLDLDSTVLDRPGLLRVLQQWIGSIRPIGPAPAGRVSREG